MNVLNERSAIIDTAGSVLKISAHELVNNDTKQTPTYAHKYTTITLTA